MPQIKVTKPFRVQFARGKRGLREFAPGEHTLTSEELEHWFVQGVIAEGRAEILPEDQAEGLVPPGLQADHGRHIESRARSLPVVQVVELVPPGPQAAHDEFAGAMFGDSAPEGILAEPVATTETTVTSTPKTQVGKVEAKPVAKAKPVVKKAAPKPAAKKAAPKPAAKKAGK